MAGNGFFPFWVSTSTMRPRLITDMCGRERTQGMEYARGTSRDKGFVPIYIHSDFSDPYLQILKMAELLSDKEDTVKRGRFRDLRKCHISLTFHLQCGNDRSKCWNQRKFLESDY